MANLVFKASMPIVDDNMNFTNIPTSSLATQMEALSIDGITHQEYTDSFTMNTPSFNLRQNNIYCWYITDTQLSDAVTAYQTFIVDFTFVTNVSRYMYWTILP